MDKLAFDIRVSDSMWLMINDIQLLMNGTFYCSSEVQELLIKHWNWLMGLAPNPKMTEIKISLQAAMILSCSESHLFNSSHTVQMHTLMQNQLFAGLLDTTDL